MNYFITKQNFTLLETNQHIVKNVVYKLNYLQNQFIYMENDELKYLNFYSSNILHFQFNQDNVYILNLSFKKEPKVYIIKHLGKEFCLSVGENITLTQGNIVICSIENTCVEYSHYEIDRKLLQLFFNGDRNFFIIIEDTKLLYSSYYDEFNNKKEEKWFMCKLHDGLNHGRVFQIGEGKVNSYTVYLDDFNLNLKERFVSHVFLDCIIAKNYAYCNYLLQEDIRLKNLQDFEKYFNDFDYFIELEEHSFALIKKNALVGIYKFEVKGNYISNIIHLS